MNFSSTEILPFRLHKFQRISWASHPARELWEPRLQRIEAALSETVDEISKAGIYKVRLSRIYYHQVEPLRRKVAQQGLEVFRIDRPVDEVSALFPSPFPEDDKRVFVLVGNSSSVQSAVVALEDGDLHAFHHSFGLPRCCTNFVGDLKESPFADPTWPMAVQSASHLIEAGDIKFEGRPETNFLLSRIGLSLLRHVPCSLNCESSIKIAENVTAILIESGFETEANWIGECLSWPCSWSALHGIAEVKTPLFKLIYDTDATAERLAMHQMGRGYPDSASAGVGFPYRLASACEEKPMT